MKKIILLFLIIPIVCVAQANGSAEDLIKLWEETNKNCSPVGGFFASMLNRSAGERSKSSCARKKSVESDLQKKSWCQKEIKKEDGEAYKTWVDCKPENLFFDPIKNFQKASDDDLINDYLMSIKNREYEKTRDEAKKANFYDDQVKSDRRELEKRNYCFDGKWRKCTTQELLAIQDQKKKNDKYNERLRRCILLNQIIKISMLKRDHGMSPQEVFDSTYQDVKMYRELNLSEKQLKIIINDVFFGDLKHTPYTLYNDSKNINYCANPPKQHKPL